MRYARAGWFAKNLRDTQLMVRPGLLAYSISLEVDLTYSGVYLNGDHVQSSISWDCPRGVSLAAFVATLPSN